MQTMTAKRLWLTILFTATTVISLVAATAAITSYTYANQLPPHAVVAGVAVGNLSFSEAQTAIEQRLSQLAQQPFPVSLEDKSIEVTLEELNTTIDKDSVLSRIFVSTSPWSWIQPTFWRDFFRGGTIDIPYSVNDEAMLIKLESALEVTSAARDAEITLTKGGLTVQPSQNGRSLELNQVKMAISKLLNAGEASPVSLSYVETAPFITTEAAMKTKTEIEISLQPVYLKFEDRAFTISKTVQYGFITYDKQDGNLFWTVSLDKVKENLVSTIAKKLNVKMQSKTILSTTGEVTFPGTTGREVQLTALANEVHRSITEHIVTTTKPILIAATMIPFTEKTVFPDYITGLFEGIYIDINISKQRLFVINGQTKVAEYLISSGKRGTPTPIGLFYIKNKIGLAQSRLYPGLWMQKWNALARNADGSGYEGYGLHRVPCFNSSCTLRESLTHLGRPASHGCVRISDEGADWVYDNAPVGTPVNIHI